MKKPFSTPKAPAPKAPYSPAIIFGNLIFCSGQVSIDPRTNELSLGTLEHEATQTLTNVRTILEEAGSSLDKVLKVTVFLADIADFQAFNVIYRKFFKEPYPARSCVQAKLAAGLKVEVEAIAYI
ncbi:MAG: reactive intermediate/imine deaminase [Planctomycetes bacterium]|nr:reactive intermediate/imine deaminase [Planctomycetota bacterium]